MPLTIITTISHIPTYYLPTHTHTNTHYNTHIPCLLPQYTQSHAHTLTQTLQPQEFITRPSWVQPYLCVAVLHAEQKLLQFLQHNSGGDIQWRP